MCLWCRKLPGLGHVPSEPCLTPNPSSLPPLTHSQVCWWCSGLAYMVSAVVPPQNVLITGVFITLIFRAFIQGLSPTISSVRGTIMEYIMALGYNRYKGVRGGRGGRPSRKSSCGMCVGAGGGGPRRDVRHHSPYAPLGCGRYFSIPTTFSMMILMIDPPV